MDAMLISGEGSTNFFLVGAGGAILSTCHIQNRIIFRKNGKTPFELQEKRLPNSKYLQVWGCLEKILIIIWTKKRKMGSTTCNYMFVDYAENRTTYRFLVYRNDVLDVNTIIESRNVEFFENLFPLKSSMGNLFFFFFV